MTTDKRILLSMRLPRRKNRAGCSLVCRGDQEARLRGLVAWQRRCEPTMRFLGRGLYQAGFQARVEALVVLGEALRDAVVAAIVKANNDRAIREDRLINRPFLALACQVPA